MKKIILILCTPLLMYSKEKLDFNKPNYNQIQWNSNFLFESNGLNKNFLNTMLYGGHITDNLKNNWINLADDRNIFYSEISNNFSYKTLNIILVLALQIETLLTPLFR